MPPTAAHDYDSWTREELIARLVELDRRPKPRTQQRDTKVFHLANHPRQKIAVKFCYSGWLYNGLAFQKEPTPLPTVEEVLFDAFARLRLVDPQAGYEGCGWERCGRTDRGVSAAGQVVSLWVRSAPERDGEAEVKDMPGGDDGTDTERSVDPLPPGKGATTVDAALPNPALDLPTPLHNAKRSELRYVASLNRILPPTVRALAWSTVSPNFSARFACRHRHYKYFFSAHGLDLRRMRDAAARLVGEHDFRNLCKLDPAKQITNFRRTIIRSDISPLSTSLLGDDKLHVLDLVGSAFLYHQVRHIMSVLFLVGSGQEHPSIVSSLLNVDETQVESLTQDGDGSLEIVDRKPEYQMADALPLMLWDCVYADGDVQWRTDSEIGEGVYRSGSDTNQLGTGSELHHQLHCILDRTLIQAALESHFLSAAERYHPSTITWSDLEAATPGQKNVLKIPLGGGTFRRTAKYVPLLQRKRLDGFEVANERWRTTKGARKNQRLQVEDKIMMEE